MSLIPLTSSGKVNWTTLKEEFPILDTLQGCPQEPEHHSEGDVWTHTQMVTEQGENLASEHNLSPQEKDELLFACVFHDIGKPITLAQEDDGKWSSRKHAVKGSAFLRFLLWDSNNQIPLKQREKLLNLIKLHAWPIRFLDRSYPDESIIKASLQTNNKLLGLLAIADMQGRICLDPTSQTKAIDTAKLYLDQAKEINCLTTPYQFPNERSKIHYLNAEAYQPPNTTLFQPEGFEVTTMSGLPCSGKDHWLEKNYQDPIISRDQIRKEMKFPNEGKVLQEFTSQIKKALAKKEPFAINATNLRQELRGGYLNLITAYGGYSKVVYLHANKRELQRRHKLREENLPEKEKIPFSAIINMAEATEPPTELECHKLILLDTTPVPKIKKKTQKQEPEPQF